MFFTKPWADALIALLVILLFFGPKRLPALGKSLGEGMREFKDSITSRSKHDADEERPELTEATASSPAPPPPPATSAPQPESAEAAPRDARS